MKSINRQKKKRKQRLILIGILSALLCLLTAAFLILSYFLTRHATPPTILLFYRSWLLFLLDGLSCSPNVRLICAVYQATSLAHWSQAFFSSSTGRPFCR